MDEDKDLSKEKDNKIEEIEKIDNVDINED